MAEPLKRHLLFADRELRNHKCQSAAMAHPCVAVTPRRHHGRTDNTNASLELQKNSRIELREFFYSKQNGLFRMVTFIPAHRSEAYALTKKDARRETALLQTFLVHHITSTFPMEQLQCRARLAHKYIHVTITRFQTHFTDLSTHTIHSHAHISRMLRHNNTVVPIQIEHNFF